MKNCAPVDSKNFVPLICLGDRQEHGTGASLSMSTESSYKGLIAYAREAKDASKAPANILKFRICLCCCLKRLRKRSERADVFAECRSLAYGADGGTTEGETREQKAAGRVVVFGGGGEGRGEGGSGVRGNLQRQAAKGRMAPGGEGRAGGKRLEARVALTEDRTFLVHNCADHQTGTQIKQHRFIPAVRLPRAEKCTQPK